MKPLKLLLLFAGLCILSTEVRAQFSISKVTPKEADVKNKKDTVKEISAVTKNPFFSESRYRAERRKLRKERNTISCAVGLSLNQTGFDNWVGGGNNTFDAMASLLYTHTYARNKFNLTYSLDSKYGMNVISGKTFKNIDYFIINVNSGWAISKNWSYSASANLRSQWTKGFRSADDKTMISNFMSPGTLTLGVGLTYKVFNKAQNRTPFVMTINPISGSMLFVLSDTLSKQGMHGIPVGRHQKSSLGSNMRIDTNIPIAKGKLNYINYFYISTNYHDNTYVEMQNTLQVRATKIFSVDLFCRTVYNELQVTPRNKALQWNYKFGLGLSYVFKNK